MTLEEIRRRQAEVREGLQHLAGLDQLDETQAREFDWLDAEERWLVEQETEARAARLAELRTVAVNPASHEPGADRGVPHVSVRTDPFDLSDIPAFGERRDAELQSRAMSAIEESRDFAEDRHKEQATKIVQRLGRENGLAAQILLTSDPEYRDAFYKAMGGELYNLTEGERAKLNMVREVTRAMALSDVTGVLVPSFLDPTVVLTNDGSLDPFRQVCRVESIATNVWTGVSSAGITGGWTGSEGTEVGDDAPSFASPAVTAFMADAFVPISFQAYEDLRGREGEIVAIIADYKDNLEADAHATGSGSNEPTGLVTALDANTNVEVSTTTSNVFGLVDVYGVYENVPARYRNARTSWFANLAILNDIRQFGTDSLSTQTVDLGADGIPRILGKRVLESSAMDGTIGTAGTDNILIVGDPQHYLIADRVGLMVEFIPNLFHTTSNRPSGQRGWLAHWRTGADSINDKAFRLLQAETN